MPPRGQTPVPARALVEAPIAARLTPPARRPGSVDRPRLTGLMRSGAAVIVVRAPAGYGKTTLLAEWVADDPRPCAWLSLDASDDDPVRLLTDIAFATERIETIDAGVFDALRSGPASVVPMALPRLGRAFSRLPGPFTLVLDDVQVLESPRAADVVSLLVDLLPPGSQLALATRAEPPWRLARLRAGGRLAEIDVAALEMTPMEGTALLRAAGVALDRQESETVVRHTEGWAAALYLASLALRERPDGAPSVERLRGGDRSLHQYFREEVLGGASPEHIEFLVRTSILRRLSGPLCDAVLGREDSATRLRELVEANLFVTPLDRRDEWYRVHQLFLESLQDELRRVDPELEAVLHGRASAWHEEHGDRELAISHALAAGDVARAADLVWTATARLQSQGQGGTLARWLSWFTRAQIAANPGLAITAAWAALDRGDGDAIRDWASVAEAGPADLVLADGSPLAGQVALLRATLAPDGLAQMRRNAERARATIPEDNPWCSLAWFVTGEAAFLAGDLAEARTTLLEADRRTSAAVPTVNALALGQLALLALEAGDVTAAASFSARCRTRQQEYGLDDHASQTLALSASALVAARQGDDATARATARRVTALLAVHRHFLVWHGVMTRTVLARAFLLLGDPIAARTLLAEAERELSQMPDAQGLRDACAAARHDVDAAGIAVPGEPSSLTTAELRVLQYLPTHLAFREIGEQLFVSRNTVKTHALSVYRKLGVTSRSEAVERARELGVLERQSAARLDFGEAAQA